MDEIAKRIARAIAKDYGRIQTDKDLKRHIKEFQNHYGDHTVSHLFHYMPREVFNNKKVLEVGCGFGGGVISLWRNGAQAYGVDIDEEAIKIAEMISKKEKVNRNMFCIGKAEDLPFGDETFDIVWNIQVLEHVQDPFKALSESIRVLKQEGIFFIHCPNYLYPWEGHYRVRILPMMPKKLVKSYLKMRCRETKFIENINYITPQKIERYLSLLPVKYENIHENKIIQRIKNPKAFDNRFFRKLVGVFYCLKLTPILIKMVQSLHFYSTCVYLGQKLVNRKENGKRQQL